METVSKFVQSFNNRELAITIWILIAIACGLSYPKTRKSFFHIIKVFFAWKLTLSYILMFTYIACVIWILKVITIWRVDHIPLTIMWCLFVAFVMLFNFQKANDQNFFINSLKDNIKGLVFLEFFINLYVFNFWIEFILIPIFALCGGMIAIAERNKEYEIVNKFLNRLLSIAGLIILFYVFYKAFTDFKNFVSFHNLESLYMPILLSILFLPFVYIAALFASYETLFLRLNYFVPDKSVRRYAKIKTILSIQFNVFKLNKWSDYINKNWRFKNKKEVNEAVALFKQAPFSSNPGNEQMV